MACVQLREGAEPLTAEALREFRTGNLAHYKIPRFLHIADTSR
jgi:fatty-acyl-CoA synthase